MVSEVEVRPRMDSLKLLEAEREVEFDVSGGICIVRKLLMVMETVVAVTHAEGLMPCKTVLFPCLEPVEFRTRLDEELHLHLLEFPHPEDELAGHNLISEGFSYLSYSERNLHAAGLLHIQVVHEYSLCRFRTQIDDIGVIGSVAELCAEHQIELAYLGPVLCA